MIISSLSTQISQARAALEMGVVGALLANSQNFDVVTGLKSSDFEHATSRAAFEMILESPNVDFDETLMASQLSSKGIGDFGSLQLFLANAVGQAPGPEALKEYVKSISVSSEQSSLKKALQKSLNALQDSGAKYEPIVSELMMSIEAIMGTGRDRKGFANIDDLLVGVFEDMQKKLDGEIKFVETGIQSLDSGISIGESDLVVIGARPSVGKTAVLMKIAMHNAEAGKSVGIFSLEMSDTALASRFLASAGNVDLSSIIRPSNDSIERADAGFQIAIKKAKKMQLWVDDQPNRSISSVIAAARSMHRKVNFDCIFVDYLTLIDGGGLKKDTMAGKVDEIVRLLKNLAKELNIPVFLLCQLNRASEQRGDKRPILSDLKESGGIEQHADIVILLHRESRYVPNANTFEHDIIELDVKKARQGRIGTYYADFVGHTQQILEIGQEAAREWIANCKPGYVDSGSYARRGIK